MTEENKSGDMLKSNWEIIDKGKWEDISEKELEDIVSCFIPKKNDIKIDMSQFDFRIFTADYYKEKFPNFPSYVYDLLEECSSKKIGTIKEEKPPTVVKTEEETVITFD